MSGFIHYRGYLLPSLFTRLAPGRTFSEVYAGYPSPLEIELGGRAFRYVQEVR